MNKEVLILVGLIAFGIFASLISFSYTESRNEALKLGLEECPKNIGYGDTIWVKDCNAYLNNLSKLENK